MVEREPGEHLAQNLRTLRNARNLTQAALARASGVPRATLASIEAGGTNPTLSVVMRLAAALRVGLEELVLEPRAEVRHYRAHEIPSTRRGDVLVRRLLPDSTPGLSLERLELPGHKVLVGSPHRPGTREYLTCERGSIELLCSGARFVLDPGDVVVFRGDQKHSYKNPAASTAVGYSVVLLSPSSS